MNYIKEILIFICFISISACSEENFLTRVPSDALDSAEAIQSITDLEAAINGVYNVFQGSEHIGRDLFVYGEVLSDNGFVSISNSNRFVRINEYSWTTQDINIDNSWEFLYSGIARSNFIINNDFSDPVFIQEIDEIKAEAYIARAFSYITLINHWSQPVNSGLVQDMGVPINLTVDAFQELPRSSVSEVYALIESDLLQAISLASGDKDDKTRFGITAARALLSRVYLYQEKWQEAKDMASLVLATGGFAPVELADYVNYWQTEDAEGTIFEIFYDVADNESFDGLANIYDQDGYGQNLAANELVDLYDSNDVRLDLYTVATRGDSPSGYVVEKFQTVGGISTLNQKILRVEEVLLNWIEAKYHLGDADTLDELNNFVARRVPGFVYTSVGTDLLDDILLERRLELAFEAHRFIDLKRYSQGVTKGANCSTSCNLSFPNDRFVFPIPQFEIDANPNADQNPGY